MTKQEDEEEVMERLEKEYGEYLRFAGPRFDWAVAIITALLTLTAVGGFSVSVANVIEMLVEHKFAYWTAAINIFWATVLLGQWIYHLAKMLTMK